MIKDDNKVSFKDIDRDLYNIASESNPNILWKRANFYITHGANATARFENEMQATLAAAKNGLGANVATISIQPGVTLNVTDVNGYAIIHIAVAGLLGIFLGLTGWLGLGYSYRYQARQRLRINTMLPVAAPLLDQLALVETKSASSTNEQKIAFIEIKASSKTKPEHDDVPPNYGVNLTNNVPLARCLFYSLGWYSTVDQMNKAERVASSNIDSIDSMHPAALSEQRFTEALKNYDRLNQTSYLDEHLQSKSETGNQLISMKRITKKRTSIFFESASTLHSVADALNRTASSGGLSVDQPKHVK